jgi:hypothetical protein
VKDEQTLRLTGESRSGIYQVLATGFDEQASKHTEVTAYSKSRKTCVSNRRPVRQRVMVFFCSNTGSIRDDPYWTSRRNSLELTEY